MTREGQRKRTSRPSSRRGSGAINAANGSGHGRSYCFAAPVPPFSTANLKSIRRPITSTTDLENRMSSFGMVGLDWQERINWERLRNYRLERAREKMKAHGLGALLLMYDENVRYVTSTL